MKSHKFTVKIDLSTFFDDERKFVLILVDPAWASVADLQLRVQCIFGLDVQFLTADDCFIPSEEPVEVLKFVDSIKAFVPLSKKAKKVKRVKVGKKRKLQSPEQCLTSSTPNQAKRPKNAKESGSTAVVILAADKSDEITSTCEALNERQTKEANKEVTRTFIGPVQVGISPAQHAAESEIICIGDEAFEEAPEPAADKDESKRKRKRAQKQKSNARSFDQSGNSTSIAKFATPSNIPSSTFLNQSHAEKPAVSLKSVQGQKSAPEKTMANDSHIYFTESGEKMTTSKEDNNTTENGSVVGENTKPFVFHCALTEFSLNKPRVFTKRKKETIEIREHLVLTPIGTQKVASNPCGQLREVRVSNRGVDVTVTNIGNQSNQHNVEDHKHFNSSMSQLLNEPIASEDEQEENIDTAQLPLGTSLNLTEVVLKDEMAGSVQPEQQLSGSTIISLDESSVIEVDTMPDDDCADKDCKGEGEGETDLFNMIDLS